MKKAILFFTALALSLSLLIPGGIKTCHAVEYPSPTVEDIRNLPEETEPTVPLQPDDWPNEYGDNG